MPQVNWEYQPHERKIKLTRTDAGFEATVDGLPEKVWQGATEQEAIKGATAGAEKMFHDRARAEKPGWMAVEEARKART